MRGPTYRSEEEEGTGASFESHVIWGEWSAAAEMLEAGDLVRLGADEAMSVAARLPTHLRLDSCGDGRFWSVRLEQPAQPMRLYAGEFKAVAS